MSLHASLSPEASAKLESIRRRTTATSILIAFFSVILIGLLLALWSLASIDRSQETIVAYVAPQSDDEQIDPPKIHQQSSKPPSAPSAAIQPIVAQTVSAMSIPLPEMEVEMPGVEFGEDDFMNGSMGAGMGMGAGGSSGPFGSTSSGGSALRGQLYDFKQDRRGNRNDKYMDDEEGLKNGEAYADIVRGIQRRKYSDASLSKYFTAPNELFLNYLAVPYMKASEGPRHFGAEKEIQPKGWLAHYSGKVRAPASGQYRFAGMSDDYMSVAVNGETALIACWPGLQKRVAGSWEGTKDSGRWNSPLAQQKLIFGDWVSLNKGEEIQLDIAIGERPGGNVGFILLVEKKTARYREERNGRPILPLFTTAPIAPKEQAEIAAGFPDFEIEFDKPLIFSTKPQ